MSGMASTGTGSRGKLPKSQLKGAVANPSLQKAGKRG